MNEIIVKTPTPAPARKLSEDYNQFINGKYGLDCIFLYIIGWYERYAICWLVISDGHGIPLLILSPANSFPRHSRQRYLSELARSAVDTYSVDECGADTRDETATAEVMSWKVSWWPDIRQLNWMAADGDSPLLLLLDPLLIVTATLQLSSLTNTTTSSS